MDYEFFMFYNVENLFPSPLEPLILETSGLRNWDGYKYNLKIRKLQNMFRVFAEDFTQLPSVIGLAEIGARSVLEDLVDENSPLHGYEIIYQPSNDARGLSVALLMDKRKYALVQVRTMRFEVEEAPNFETRDILHAELHSGGKKIHFLVCHLPSKRNRDIKKDQRAYIVKQLKKTISALNNEDDAIFLMGDFNENPDSQELLNLLTDNNGGKLLANPFLQLFRERQFTTYHGKEGLCFDQILYNDTVVLRYPDCQSITAAIYNAPQLRNKDYKSGHYPKRTYSGSRYLAGLSDHFPVLLKLKTH